MNETAFQTKLKKWLNNNVEYCSVDKIHQGQFGSGISDLVGAINGRYFSFECKVITLPKRKTTTVDIYKTLTPQQRYFMDQKLDAMADCYVAFWIEPIRKCLLVSYEDAGYHDVCGLTQESFIKKVADLSGKHQPFRWCEFGALHVINLNKAP